MRILLVNWQDPENPRAGGAEIHLREVFGRLNAGGHEVVWLVSGWSGARRHATVGGMEVHRVASRYTFGLGAVFAFRRHLAARPFDIVVEGLNKVPVYSPLWAGHPVVLLVHHLFGTTAFHEAPGPLAALTWLQERPLARVYRGAGVQAISRSTAQDLVARGVPDGSVTVIEPGVDSAFFHPASSPFRAPTPTFLYLGRLQRYKRVDLIIAAFAELCRELPVSRLLIAGRGDQEASLRRLAAESGVEDRVDFLGFVTEERKRELFRSAWANVFTSPKEGWGITVFEAGACGTPTIASDSPGLREAVVDERTGILVRHGELPGLVGAMKRLANDPGLVDDLGAAARLLARTFTWDRAAERTESHLNEHLMKSRRVRERSDPPREGEWPESR